MLETVCIIGADECGEDHLRQIRICGNGKRYKKPILLTRPAEAIRILLIEKINDKVEVM